MIHDHGTHYGWSLPVPGSNDPTERDYTFNFTVVSPAYKGSAWEEGTCVELELCCVEEDKENGLIVPEEFYTRLGITGDIIRKVQERAVEFYEPDEPDPPEPMDRD